MHNTWNIAEDTFADEEIFGITKAKKRYTEEEKLAIIGELKEVSRDAEKYQNESPKSTLMELVEARQYIEKLEGQNARFAEEIRTLKKTNSFTIKEKIVNNDLRYYVIGIVFFILLISIL